MAIGSPLNSFSIISLASPYSGLDAEISRPSLASMNFTACEQAAAELEEEMAFVLREFHLPVVAGFGGKALHFGHRLFGDENARFGGEAFEFMVALDHGEAMAVGGNHGD